MADDLKDFKPQKWTPLQTDEEKEARVRKLAREGKLVPPERLNEVIQKIRAEFRDKILAEREKGVTDGWHTGEEEENSTLNKPTK